MKMLDVGGINIELSNNNRDGDLPTASEKETKCCSNFNGAAQIGHILLLKIEIVLFGLVFVVFVNEMNNKFRKQLENKNIDIYNQSSYGIAIDKSTTYIGSK